MASLTTLLKNKYSFFVGNEQNLERGEIYSYYPGNHYTNFRCHVCWVPPRAGCARIEIWGAGGSGAEMCCCGGGLPGNPGAYSTKCIRIEQADIDGGASFVCGVIGFSCGNSSDLCHRGRSEPTQICWFGNNQQDGCMCAQGGKGGYSYCSTGTSLYCCFVAGGFCGNRVGNDGCGVVCNYKGAADTDWCAQAYGGDINCYGGFSCARFERCQPNCNCGKIMILRIPAGMWSECGGEIHYAVDQNGRRYRHSGAGGHMGATHPLNLMGRNPTQGSAYSACWTGNTSCGCYEWNGCTAFMPAGIPGQGATPCDGVRDHAHRGGHGMIRIRFIADVDADPTYPEYQ